MSKIKHWKDMSEGHTPGKRPDYMNKMRRKQCGAIMKVRTQTLQCKMNMKWSYQDKSCRWCKSEDTPETQEHILQNWVVTKEGGHDINYMTAFKNIDTEEMKNLASKIITIEDKLNEKS